MYDVLVFGTGNGAEKVVKFIECDKLKCEINVLAFVDNNKNSDYFCGKGVIKPNEIAKYEYNYIIIASMWFDEIIPQLLSLGIEREKIVPFFDRDYWIDVKDKFAIFLLENKHQFLKEPLGHFYSPVPSLKDVRENADSIFFKDIKSLDGINLNLNYQVEMFNIFQNYYSELPFSNVKTERLRYHYENRGFEYADSIILYSMLRYFKPNKLIEVGCGYSSCVTLDVNELFLSNKVNCTFIEPYPELFKSLVHEGDVYKIIEKRLQDVELQEFDNLEEGDILFIDSTHVSKVNSDVNYIIFNILPRLKKGVIIHFHDIFYPFEYPQQWIYDCVFWNEAYILRAFLQYNDSFEIIFFNNYFISSHREDVEEKMPLLNKDSGGSIWIRKVK